MMILVRRKDHKLDVSLEDDLGSWLVIHSPLSLVTRWTGSHGIVPVIVKIVIFVAAQFRMVIAWCTLLHDVCEWLSRFGILANVRDTTFSTAIFT